MRRIGGHGVAIHESSGIEHAKAVTFESRLLGGRVPRNSEKVEDGSMGVTVGSSLGELGSLSASHQTH